ncbi:MAG TPA: AMP-binding protein [Solirubrobacteraceae bacterium]|nr:AMP-binding protein [Solirubrobacteraceae bacterium]
MPGPTVGDLIRKRRLARGDAHKTAIAFGEERLTYGELDERTDHIAHGLVAAGFTKGERAAILAHNCIEYLEAFFAVAKAGGVNVPINYLLRANEVAYHLDDSGATWTFVQDRFLELMHPIAAERAGHRLVVFGAAGDGEIAFADLRDGAEGELPQVVPDDIALLQYTSGTTGRPKGATHTQRGIVLNAAMQALDIPLREDDVYLAIPALCWAAGLHSIFSPELFRGASIVLHPSSGFDPDNVCALVARERVTTIVMVPVVLRAVLDSGAFERHDVSSLRLIIVGAEPVPVELLDRLDQALPGVQVVQGYGQSEFPTIMATLDPRYAREKAGSTGKALSLSELRVVDDEGLDVPAGEHGEILCRAACTMLGYWNKPEETATAFLGDWLRTGDRGWLDEDGFLYIAGRSKDMIISGGLNVYPAEIERVLAEHPAVAECAVVGTEDARLGEVGRAFVVTREQATVSEAELEAYCREQLAGYKVPRHWVLRTEPLPRTASGKAQKFNLTT